MTDIVDELRARALQGPFNLDAASEIRKLRAELAEKNAAIIQINNICLRVEQECDTLRAELSEQCRLLGMSGEREAKHLAQIAALEKERDDLRAKIEEMEKQEPAAWRTFDGEGGYDYRSYEDNENYKLGWDARNPNHIGWVEPLYALPGAQPAPSLPEGWKLVPTAESRHPGIYKMLGALHAIDNTRGASEWESYAAMLAAAPEAKP